MRRSYTLVLLVVMLLTACSANPESEPGQDGGGRPDKATPAAATDASSTGQSPPAARSDVDRAEQSDGEKDEGPPLSQDARYRQLVVGTWEDDYEGHRTMTLNKDGSGTMIVELSGMKATLFASRLEFNMQWSLEDGRLKKRTIDGKPERRVNMILKMMGDRVDEPILELTQERLLLLDKDGETKYDWRRKPE